MQQSHNHYIKKNREGVTLIELLIVLLILSIIVAGLSEIISINFKSSRANKAKTEMVNDLSYVIRRIVDKTRDARKIFIPTNANPVRDILALAAGVDNDNDGLVDEDDSSDLGNDGQPGLAGFDDDGDGIIDEGGASMKEDDDEDGFKDEDIPGNGLDDDGDGNYDEELQADMGGSGCPPTCAYDDDGDGMFEEDPADPLIFYLQNGAIYEKEIVWDPGTKTTNVRENILLDNVVQFRVERTMGSNGKTLIKIRIKVSTREGEVLLESDAYPRKLPAVTP